MAWCLLKHGETLPYMKQQERHSLVHFNAYVFWQEAKWLPARTALHTRPFTPARVDTPRRACVGEVAAIARRNIIREISLS